MFTTATACVRHRTSKALSHTFDPVSGWCKHGCGNRDDGRISTREGNDIQAGPQYTQDELDQMKGTR